MLGGGGGGGAVDDSKKLLEHTCKFYRPPLQYRFINYGILLFILLLRFILLNIYKTLFFSALHVRATSKTFQCCVEPYYSHFVFFTSVNYSHEF